MHRSVMKRDTSQESIQSNIKNPVQLMKKGLAYRFKLGDMNKYFGRL